MKRYAIATLALVACAFGIWQAARAGIARTESRYALVTNDRDAAARAVAILPNDAETHAIYGVVLQHRENYSEAVRELERAVQLRPRDYYPWMMLGVTRDLNGDAKGALAAFLQSIALAPNYGKTHWQLGNFLLRLGQPDEAFKELQFAAASDSSFLPNVIDLAWGLSGNDPAKTVETVQPRSDEARIALAIFLAQHQQGSAALDQFRALRSFSGERLDDLVHELLAAKLYVEAYEVWARLHNVTPSLPSLMNGSFEDEIAVGQKGFGWLIPAEPANVTISIDTAQFQSGAKSLHFDFHGNSKPAEVLALQIVAVKPGTRYRLAFQTSSKNLVSAAPPIVVVESAAEPAVLARSPSLVSDGAGWREVANEFTTDQKTNAVLIKLARTDCASDPCAIFGTLWLDSFALNELPPK
jgi:Flp pilus assembly protein TadD